MTLVLLQYPAVVVAFAVSAALAGRMAFTGRCHTAHFALAGAATAATVILSLIFSIPMTELLLMLGILLLIIFAGKAKEETK